jgi:hypothetical protein
MTPHEIMILNACYKCSSPAVNVLPHIWNAPAAVATRRAFVKLGLIDPETHKATERGERHIERLCAVGFVDEEAAPPSADHPGKAALSAIVEGLKGVTPGPWWADSERSEGGDGRFDAFAVYGPEQRYGRPSSICDTHNAGEIVIQHEHDTTPWDEQGRVNMDHIARCDPATMQSIAAYVAELTDRIADLERDNGVLTKEYRAFMQETRERDIEFAQKIGEQQARAERAEAALAEASKVIERLKLAMHDAINRPMGVVPATAEEFYDPRHPTFDRLQANKGDA